MTKNTKQKETKQKEKKFKYWGAISYPGDSEPADVFERAKKSNIECCCIVHDCDFNELATPSDYSGEILQPGQAKKTHRHWIFAFPNTTTQNHAEQVIIEITNGLKPQGLSNVKGAYAYLTHKHDPDKYQYDADLIQYFNGFVPENYISLGAGEEDAATIAIEQIIETKDFEEYHSLMLYLRNNHQDLARFLSNHTIHINAYLRSKHQAKRQKQKDYLLELQIAHYQNLLGTVDPSTGEVLTDSPLSSGILAGGDLQSDSGANTTGTLDND